MQVRTPQGSAGLVWVWLAVCVAWVGGRHDTSDVGVCICVWSAWDCQPGFGGEVGSSVGG